jgi:spore maturation protein CgeB
VKWVVAHPGPSQSVHDVCVGWIEGLREVGEEVHVFNLDDRLALYSNAMLDTHTTDRFGRQVFKFAFPNVDDAVRAAVNGLAATLWHHRPQVLLIIAGHFIPHEFLDQARSYGIRVVALHTEQPYELERELALSAHADLTLLNDPTHKAKFENVCPTVYAPHAYRPAVHYPGQPVGGMECDFAFVGTGFGSRRWFFEQMHAAGAFDDLRVTMGGNWRGIEDDSVLRRFLADDDPEACYDNAKAADLYRSAKVGINLYRREHDEGSDALGMAMGPREVELAACGAFFLRDPRPESDVVLGMLPSFTSPEEATDQLKWWLSHDDERQKMAMLAREAIADRTFANSAGRLVRLLTGS